MSEQQTAFPVDCSPVEVQPDSDRASVSLAPALDKSASSSKLLEALKWIFSFPAMLGVALIGRVFYQGRGFSIDPDMWWHIKVGQDIVHNHHWPTSDPYSFTVHGTPWMAYEWLGDVALGFVGRFGLQALDALLIGLGSIIMIALYYYASLCARNSKAGFASAGLLCTFAFGNFNLRPQMFGALFLVITLIVLERFRQGHTKGLWILPPIMLLWINAHGSWIIGVGVMLVTLAGGLFNFQIGSVEGVRWTPKQRIQLELALLGCLAVIPITPYGTRLATYPFLIAFSLPLNVANVMEWFPMPFDITWGKFFLGVIVGAFVLQALFHFKFRLQQWILGLGGIVMACMHVRFVILFVPFFAPILAIMLARWLDVYRREKDKYILNFALMAGVVFAMVWYFPKRADLEHKVESQFPVRAVNFLRAHPVQGPMYNNYGYGGYLVANLPEQKVFIDGREDLYEFEGVMGDFLQVVWIRPAAFPVLRFYGIKMCLLSRGEPLAVVLAEHPDWKRIYYDDTSVIYVRRDSLNAAVASERPQPSLTRSEHESPAD